jgi:hypothetical protein
MNYGILLIVGVIVQVGLRLFAPTPPPAGLRWVRMAVALMMLFCVTMIWVDDYRDRRRAKAAAARGAGGADAATGAAAAAAAARD